MSYTFTLTGSISDKHSILHSNINPPIVLEEDSEYVIGLINFEAFNSIPNIDSTNNKFYIDGKDPFEIPEGSYEISDINKLLKRHFKDPRERARGQDYYTFIDIKGNNNTLHTEIKCDKVINFKPEDSIGKLLGYEPRKLKANKVEVSDHPANILKVNAVCIHCSLVSGSYRNNEEVHIIHQMFPNVDPGFKIVDSPNSVIYLPINTRVINSITIKILDQDGNSINFRGEVVTIRLHLKRV